MSEFNFENPVFANFAFYSGVVITKMLALGFLTGVKRISRGIYANPEDAASHKMMTGKTRDLVLNHPVVERLRRNHLNDLENIVPWVLLGYLYVATKPDVGTALWHFRIFAGSKIVHTLVYQLAIPQPARALAHTVGLGVMASMMYRIFQFASSS